MNLLGGKQFCGESLKLIFSGTHISILNSFERIQGFIAQMIAAINIHQLGTNDIVAMGRAGAAKMRLTTVGLVAGGARRGGGSAGLRYER